MATVDHNRPVDHFHHNILIRCRNRHRGISRIVVWVGRKNNHRWKPIVGNHRIVILQDSVRCIAPCGVRLVLKLMKHRSIQLVGLRMDAKRASVDMPIARLRREIDDFLNLMAVGIETENAIGRKLAVGAAAPIKAVGHPRRAHRVGSPCIPGV